MDIKKLPISQRLRMNAALVPECEMLADVGCDHAYTCLYLVAGGVAKRALALDVRMGPLFRAQENIRLYGMEGRIGTRLSDGLSALLAAEADCILICGMGAPLMIDILAKDWEKVLAAKCIVLQPQSEIARVREFLHKRDLEITAEDMCREEGKYYTVMRAKRADGPAKERAGGCALSLQAAYRYGACLIADKHPVLREYAQREFEKKCELERRLSGQMSAHAGKRCRELREELSLLEEVLRLLPKGKME